MQCESAGTSACAPKGDVCACVCTHRCDALGSSEGDLSPSRGQQLPWWSTSSVPWVPFSERRRGTGVKGGCMGTRPAPPCSFPAMLQARWSSPAQARQLWDVGKESIPRCPNPTYPRPHHGPPASFGPGRGCPQCSLCLPGAPPHSTKRLFPSLDCEAVLSSQDR